MGVIELSIWVLGTLSCFSVPYILWDRYSTRRIKQMEEEFPTFLNGIVEALRGGLGLEASVMVASESSRGPLSLISSRLVTNLNAGMSFTDALLEFARESNSRMICRAVSILKVAVDQGAELAETIDTISNDMWNIYMLQMERDHIAKKEGSVIVLGGVVLSPMILGFTFGFMSGMARGTELLVSEIFLLIIIIAFVSSVFYGLVSRRMRYSLILSPVLMFLAAMTYWLGNLMRYI